MLVPNKPRTKFHNDGGGCQLVSNHTSPPSPPPADATEANGIGVLMNSILCSFCLCSLGVLTPQQPFDGHDGL